MPLSKDFLLTLLNAPKIGRVSTKAINSNTNFKVTSVNDLLDAIVDAKTINSRIPLPDILNLHKAYDHARRVLDVCEKTGVEAISVNETQYPIKLMRLDDYPLLVYIKGATSAVNAQFTAGVIGTREPSSYGVKAGRRISNILARHGFSIISGLALGCDTVGHLGALDANAPTVAVLASGVDIVYPKENQYLADKILEQGGALFSEYEVGVKAHRSSFVERDRLQTGLSDGLVIVETDIQGGTMHAVRCAQKLNVPLGCISSHPESLQDYPKIRGNKMLIGSGAFPLGNIDQIFTFIQKLNPNIPSFIPQEEQVKSLNDISASNYKEMSTLAPIPDALYRKSKEILVSHELIQSNESSVPKPSILKPAAIYYGSDIKSLPSIEELSKKISEMTVLITKMAKQQEVNSQLLNELLKKPNSKEKPTKEKVSKAEKNQTKLL